MIAWLFALAMQSSAPVEAHQSSLAPLPAHFAHEASRGEHEYFRPVPDQDGIYAYGVADRIWSREYDGAPCLGQEAEQDQAIASLPADGMAEFWFYATRSQGILLTRTAQFDVTKSCSKALSFQYDVERAYISDGFIHSFSINQSNGMDSIGSWPTTHSAAEYSSKFQRLHSLMARPRPNKRDRKQSIDTIAGVSATCRGVGGIVWSSVCTARSGQAKGMILRAVAGDDEQILFTTEIKEIKTHTKIPGILFEVDRAWNGTD